MEKWKKIEGFQDYSVSDLGRVRRDTPSRKFPEGGHTLKPGVGSKGHHYVNLYGKHSKYVHRLVLFAFSGAPPKNKPCAGHINGDPSDNRLSNLRWVSYKENSADSIRHGTSSRPSGSKHFRAKLNSKIISEARDRNEGGESLRSIARSIGVSHGTLSYALRGRSYRNEKNNGDNNSL